MSEDEEQQAIQQEQSVKDEERELRAKINKIRALSNSKTKTKLTNDEKRTLNQAKKFPRLKKSVDKIQENVKANLIKMKQRIARLAATIGPIGFVVIIIVILALAAGAVLTTMLVAKDSIKGITGKDFYGARMVYKNDELAARVMIEDCVNLVESGIEETKTISSSVNINIELPEEDYDYLTFDETEFQKDYPVLYSTIFDVAKVVYKADNSNDFAGLNLLECANGILYFGFSQSFMPDMADIITNAIITNISGEVNASQIKSKLDSLYSQPKYDIRTEKLFIKDYILVGEERIKDVPQENYVAFIFMPNKDVTFKQFSFSVGNADMNEFTINLANNGSEIEIKKDNVSLGNKDDEKQTYLYMTKKVNINASIFNDIDISNIHALSEGLSLFDIVERIDNYTLYLDQTTGENSIQYLTFKKNGVVVSLSNKEAFNFVESETIWK